MEGGGGRKEHTTCREGRNRENSTDEVPQALQEKRTGWSSGVEERALKGGFGG